MRGATSAKWVAGAAIIALAATACGSDDGDSNSDKKPAAGAVNAKGIFSVEVGEPQNPLQPANTMESNGSIVVKSLFSQLVDYDAKGQIKM
ncbi:ABC transporter substrate-binding protein, partial [Streptomyces sp. SID11233]|nr:ABC transporter substrate-binding protein [Streptomyces sp. SID11233]